MRLLPLLLCFGLLLGATGCDTAAPASGALAHGSAVATTTPDGPALTVSASQVEALYAGAYATLRGGDAPSLKRAYVDTFADGTALLVMLGDGAPGACETVSAELHKGRDGTYSLGGEGYTCRNTGGCSGDCIPTTNHTGGATCGCDEGGQVEMGMPGNGCEMQSSVILEG